MNIVAAFKVVPDDQDIQVASDGSLDYSKAKGIVSTYDLNAIEAAAQLAAANEGSKVIAVTVGGVDIDDSKLKKNVLARGVDELYMTADDACAGLDAFAAAAALAELLSRRSPSTSFSAGDGSADNYAQQVDVQLAAKLGLPVVNAATKITVKGDALEVERMLRGCGRGRRGAAAGRRVGRSRYRLAPYSRHEGHPGRRQETHERGGRRGLLRQ